MIIALTCAYSFAIPENPMLVCLALVPLLLLAVLAMARLERWVLAADEKPAPPPAQRPGPVTVRRIHPASHILTCAESRTPQR